MIYKDTSQLPTRFYALGFEVSLAKGHDRELSLGSQGLSFSSALVVGPRSFAELTEILSQCELFIEKLRRKYAVKVPPATDREKRFAQRFS